MALIDELCAETYIWHGPGGVTVKGQAGIREMMEGYFTVFPDLQVTIEDQMADGEKVITRFTGRGTHNGPLEGIAPTGKSVRVTGIIIGRLEGGKLVEDWQHFDELGMMMQIGAVSVADCYVAERLDEGGDRGTLIRFLLVLRRLRRRRAEPAITVRKSRAP